MVIFEQGDPEGKLAHVFLTFLSMVCHSFHFMEAGQDRVENRVQMEVCMDADWKERGKQWSWFKSDLRRCEAWSRCGFWLSKGRQRDLRSPVPCGETDNTMSLEEWMLSQKLLSSIIQAITYSNSVSPKIWNKSQTPHICAKPDSYPWVSMGRGNSYQWYD